jgi:hypothetical protein
MTATSALIDVNTIVDRFLLKYKLSTEDAFIYLEHCANAIRDFHLYDSPNVVPAKVSISSLGIIEMPSDMVGFNELYKFVDGVKWAFTLNDNIITTTTTTAGVEGQDSAFGEGEAIKDPKSDTYGGVGGVNDYYYKLDWKARRIFCDGIISDTVVLLYTTSGIELSGTTYVPEFITPMLDSYMLWKSSYWIPTLVRERQSLEKDYTNAESRARNLINAMGYNEWHDLLLSITTQAPLR